MLDYFKGSHQKPLELAVTAITDAGKNSGPQGTYPLQIVSHRIKTDQAGLGDLHGHSIADLDGDGTLDLLLTGGGGLGGDRNAGNTNKLLWGEHGPDALSGEETTIFRGGSAEAEAAGIALKERRGRFNFILDFNQDGLLDVFFAADRLKIERHAPGVLMLNQGNRKWKAETAIREYSKALMMSDVDGDGFANELIITRDFCYPRKKPPYNADVVEFCKSRPVGTTAVFKYNRATGQADDIGKRYSEATPEESRQPPCCTPGRIGAFRSNNRNCHVRSLGSGDFDGDLLADQVFLYCSKLIFYFSSDRKAGELPFGKRIVGSEVYLPADCDASALRIFDIDNNGIEEILVPCFQAGKNVVLTRGKTFRDWSIDNGCNRNDGLGDLNLLGPAYATEQDVKEIYKSCESMNSRIAQLFCRNRYVRDGDKQFELKTAGVTNVDLNNDGFLDLVVAYKAGKLQFFENLGSATVTPNRFIAFKLAGGALEVGSTLVLYSRNCEGCETQFREVSSYQNATDKYGYKDDRIVFGLGAAGVPISLLVRWQDGSQQTVDLQDWEYTRHMKPLTIVKAAKS